jgi:chondroitin AC lyase
MCKADTAHSKIYQSLLDKNFRPTIVGEAAASKHFWRSDLTVFRGKQHYISVRSCSPRVMGTEFVNNENKKGHFLADGNTLIMRRGDEYRDIIPFWDWNKLPGVTAPILENTNQRAGDSYKNKHPFVGGLCAGENGISTFHLDRNAVQARKSYFYLGGKLLCLGNGIQSSTNKEIITGINQSLLKGKVYYAVDKNVITMRDSLITFEQPQWIWHDSIGYCMLSPSRLLLSQQRQTGDWHDIMDSYSSEIKSGNVFKLWIDHGKDASLSTSYAYAVLPSVSVADMKSFSKKPSVEVLANTEQVQAIRDVDCKIVELVFHQPVSINSFSKSEFIQSITPGLVMMEKGLQGKIRLTVADPTQFQKEFVLKLSGQYCGEGTEYIEAEKTTLVRLKLPVGGMAGSAVSVSLQ